MLFTTNAVADSNVSPYSFINTPNVTDSFDIEYNMMMERYKSLNLERSEEVLTYSGSTLWDYMTDVEVYGTIMYALDINGLRIFDITDVTTPTLIKNIYFGFGATPNLMSRDGHFLFISRADRMYIFDIAEPLEPQQVSVTVLNGTLMDIQVIGNRAYVGIVRYSNDHSNTPALYILDITDLSTPHILGKYESPSWYKDARKFVIVDNYIYSVCHWDDRIEVISIEDETRPEYVGYIGVSNPLGIQYRNGYLYVSGSDLYVIDVTVPESPTLIHTYETEYSLCVKIHNDRLFLVEYSDPLIHAYDFIGAWELDSLGTHNARGTEYDLAFDGSLMFVPEGLWGMTVADISNPSSMPRIGEFSHDCSTLRGIDIDNDVAYATNYMSYFTGDSSMSRNGIYVVDVSDKENPEFIRHVYIAGNTSDALVHDSLLIISQCPRTYIYSLTDPLYPSFLGQYLPDEYRFTHSNLARGSYMYVCGSGWGFEIASIADPTYPVLLATVKGEGESRYSTSAILRQNIAYVFDGCDAGSQDELRMLVVDISNAQSPEILEDFLIKSHPWYEFAGREAVARGDYLYLAGGEHGIITIDVSDPAQPDVASVYEPENARYYYPSYRRDYLFAAAPNSIEIFSITDPENPVLVQFLPLSSTPGKMRVEGDYLHAACKGGYLIFKINLLPLECGDADASGDVDIDDAVYLIAYIFSGGLPPDSTEVGDVDCSGGVDIDDVVYLIMYIFSGGPAPCADCL
jgi:hypothetical protein